MYRGRPPLSISRIRPPKLDSFGGEHLKALLYLPQASPLAIPSCTELPIRSRIIIHGCPMAPSFSNSSPYREDRRSNPLVLLSLTMPSDLKTVDCSSIPVKLQRPAMGCSSAKTNCNNENRSIATTTPYPLQHDGF